MPLIPSRIPEVLPALPPGSTTSTSDEFSLYDIAINDIGFMFATTEANPMIRQTAPFEKARIDQAETPGEQTLTGWWLKSQESFHGGAGQLYLEPPVPTPVTHVRFDASKNVDVFTPGFVTRLPDTAVVTADQALKMISLTVSGADAVAYLKNDNTVHLITNVTGSPSIATFSGVSGVQSIATDGARIYAATNTAVFSLNPASLSAAVNIAAYPATATVTPVIEWVKARLMCGVNGAVYEIDVSATGVTLGATQLKFQHPTPTWTWRCISESPTTILIAGDGGSRSGISQFALNEVSGAPVLQYDGDAAMLPPNERILSMRNLMGTYLVIGTTRGVRVGQFDTYFSRLSYGPLELLPTDPTIPCNDIISRDRFAYAVGMAYDESGLIAIDLGTKTDEAGRFAWSSHLIAPATTATPATCGTILPMAGRILFCIPGVGILLEGATAGSGREAWLRTSRIRFDTTEPKLFKLGLLRGDLSNSEVVVTGTTSDSSTALATVGFVASDPPEFKLPSTATEWLALTFTLEGAPCLVRSYSVKALPGTRRQRILQFVVAIYDTETARAGQRIRNRLFSRAQLNALEDLDAAGDEVILQEFTPNGVVSTICVVQELAFQQIGRPTRTSDLGGTCTITLRTVES